MKELIIITMQFAAVAVLEMACVSNLYTQHLRAFAVGVQIISWHNFNCVHILHVTFLLSKSWPESRLACKVSC